MRPRRLRISSALSLPLDAVTERIAIVSMSGMGKSYTAGVMAEEMLKAKQQVVIIDPKGDHFGLRTRYKILIMGGKRGDVGLSDTGGALVAQFVARTAASVILDLDGMSVSGQKRFMVDFMEELYRINEAPMHLIIDEADEFIPERPMKGEERMLGAGNRIVRRGRSKGLGVTLITQRTAAISKNSLNQCRSLILHGMIGTQDLAVVENYLKFYLPKKERDQILKDVLELDVGEAIVFSPRWLKILKRLRIRKKETFDSSATPQAGRKRRVPKRLKKVDLKHLEAQMKETVAKVEESDPGRLRKRIRDLQLQLQKAQAATPATGAVERTRTEVRRVREVSRVDLAELNRLFNRLKKLHDRTMSEAERLRKDLKAIARKAEPALNKVFERLRKGQRHVEPKPRVEKPALPRPEASTSPGVEPVSMIETSRPRQKFDDGGKRLRTGAIMMLQVLDRAPPEGWTAAELGTLSGYSVGSGSYNTYASNLRKRGFIENLGSGRYGATDSGRRWLREQGLRKEIPSEPAARIRIRLRTGARRMLQALLEAYPDSVSDEALSEGAGFSVGSGSWNTYLSNLRRHGLMERNSHGKRAAEFLFK